ncbi:MAG: chromate transporter, partial [Proteobacteria bacterium]|nr:chromate transporter [Pseudomonadota bacterium]
MSDFHRKPATPSPALSRLFAVFLRLGTTAFGGPAMIAYIRELAVERELWLDQKTFRDGVALCQTIPGATAMQVAAYVGLKVRGVRGAITSYLGFGLPAFLLMTALSVLYSRTHSLPAVVAAFSGLQAIIV